MDRRVEVGGGFSPDHGGAGGRDGEVGSETKRREAKLEKDQVAVQWGLGPARGRERLNVERGPVDVVMGSLETSMAELLESADRAAGGDGDEGGEDSLAGTDCRFHGGDGREVALRR